MPLSRRLSFEPLESRQMLAVDLTVVDVDFVDPTDVFGSATGTPVEGQKIVLRADVSLSGLTGSELYDLRFDIDGVAIDVVDAQTSAGQNITHIWARDGWVARPNTSHTVTVTVDPDNAIAEMDESNNVFTFQFTPDPPTSLPQKFINPVAGVESVDWIADGYVDVDPRFCSTCFEDYRGNTTLTRDFHNGIDFRIVNFAQADRGVDVRAAADGTVTLAQDGNFDRWLNPPFPSPEGNRVFIDHGNGWVTQYYHLQRDSVSVNVGDPVTAGQVLGRVGSSGNSFAPHLHFEVQYNNSPVEPFVSPNDYFVDPAGYAHDNDPVLHDLGVTSIFPRFWDAVELTSDNDAFPAESVLVRPWVILSSIEQGDTWNMKLYRPNGSEFFQDPAIFVPFEFDENTRGSWQFNRWYPVNLVNPEPGNWRAEVFVNGVSVGEETFVVGRELPELRVVEDVSDTTAIEFNDPRIIDNRRTPIDFGQAPQGGTDLTKTLIAENHGFADLIISAVNLPPGFSLAEPLDATIAESTLDTFTIALDTTTVGPKSGTVQIISNDRAAADLDADGDVDGSNFLEWQRGAGITSGATVAAGDANGDGAVNGDDLSLLLLQYASSTETLFEFAVEGEVTAPLSAAMSLGVPYFDVALSASEDSGNDELLVHIAASAELTVAGDTEPALSAAISSSDDGAENPLANDQQTKRKRANSRADSLFSLLGIVELNF